MAQNHLASMLRKHPWRNDPLCRIDVTGFLSIMVVFLAIFLAPVYSSPDLPRNVVDLPHASHLVLLNDAAREDAIHIYVSRDGRLYFRNIQISRNELPGKIREAVQQGSRPTVFVSADRHTRYADVAFTLEGVQSAGITKIAFVANSKNQ